MPPIEKSIFHKPCVLPFDFFFMKDSGTAWLFFLQKREKHGKA